MTRVLEVLGRSAGGIARHVALVTASLDGEGGFKVDVAAPPGLPISMPKVPLHVDIPDGPLRGHRRAIGRLRRLVSQYDVVHAHGLRAGIDAGIAARSTRTTSFVTVHNLVRPEIAGRLRAPVYRMAEAAAVWATDHTFAVSHDIARHLASRVPGAAGKIEVLYLGIGDAPRTQRPPAEVRRDLGLSDTARLIACVARLAPQKAIHVLLGALALLDADVHAVIIGEGPLAEALGSRARHLGVGERTHFLGFRADVADLVAAADVFCLSSVWEGVPLSVQEAILLGVPVAATDVGGMRELVSNKVSGRLVPAGDPSALADALREVLEDPQRARGYARAAREHLEARFSTDAMLDRLREAYES